MRCIKEEIALISEHSQVKKQWFISKKNFESICISFLVSQIKYSGTYIPALGQIKHTLFCFL